MLVAATPRRPDLSPGSAPFHPLPPGLGFCVVIPGFLSRQACRELIARSEAGGFSSAATDYPPSYRNNERLVLDDPALAASMRDRLRPHAPPRLPLDEAEASPAAWVLDGVNARFRFCRYRAGQQFRIHQDGVHHRGPAHRSGLTFMVYLTDGDDFEGGDTVFFATGPAADAAGEAPPPVVARVRPRAGSLILFDHRVWHAGETVSAGVKHILRSDVLYRREAVAVQATTGEASAPAPFTPAHQGYVWTMAALPSGGMASGGRDAVIRLWHEDGRAQSLLTGHERSVLGLVALDGDRLASVSRDRTLRLWHLPTRRCEAVHGLHDAAVLSVARAGPAHVATGGADGRVGLLHRATGQVTRLAGHSGWVWALAPLGDHLLASASEDGSVRLWDLPSGRCREVLAGAVPLRTLAAHAHGGLLATGDLHGRVRLWAPTGPGGAWQVLRAWQAHGAAVRRVRFLDDATLASTGEDHRVRLWAVATGTCRAEVAHTNFATDVLPLPGAFLTCSYDGTIRRHDRHGVPPAAPAALHP